MVMFCGYYSTPHHKIEDEIVSFIMHLVWYSIVDTFWTSIALLLQRRAAVRCGNRACRPQSWCLHPISPPLPWGTLREAVMTALWVSTPFLMINSSPINTRSIISRHPSTIRHPWITSMHTLHSQGVTIQAVHCSVQYTLQRDMSQYLHDTIDKNVNVWHDSLSSA